jgi:hypothetical protein
MFAKSHGGKLMPEEKQMYTKVPRRVGCDNCGAGELYDIVLDNGGPREMVQSTAWEDEEFADEIVNMLNAAYAEGIAAR